MREIENQNPEEGRVCAHIPDKGRGWMRKKFDKKNMIAMITTWQLTR
jgi:hypothetical protein